MYAFGPEPPQTRKPGALLICGECFDEDEGDMCFMLAAQEV